MRLNDQVACLNAVIPGVHGPQPADGAAVPLGTRAAPSGRASDRERRWTPGENRDALRSVQDVLFPLLWKLHVLRAVRSF